MDNKTNLYAEYKSSPIGMIPSDWDEVKLGDLIDKIVGGGTPSRVKTEYWNGNIFWATVKDFTSYNPNSTEETITELGLKNSSSNLIPKGTLIIATRMALGKVMEYNIDVAINQDLKAIFPSKELDIKYLFYWFQKNVSVIEGLGNGSTVKGITLDDLKGIKCYKIPLPEQKAIASLLSTWDVAIQNNAQLIAQKELRKKWLMQQLLTGKKRLKGFSGEWKEVHIKDISKEVSMRNKTDKQLTVLSCTKYDGLVHSLEYWGRKIFSDDISTYKIVPKNHFAYATNHIEEGSIGYQNILDEALISPMYTVFKTDSSVNDDFFYKLLKSHKLIYQYQNRMEGSIDRRGGLRWDAFSIIKIKLPKIEEQTAITKVLQASDKEIQLLKAKTDKLKEQKKGLMQVLLNGKKRLKIK